MRLRTSGIDVDRGGLARQCLRHGVKLLDPESDEKLSMH